jgi:hypothetical protein
MSKKLLKLSISISDKDGQNETVFLENYVLKIKLSNKRRDIMSTNFKKLDLNEKGNYGISDLLESLVDLAMPD